MYLHKTFHNCSAMMRSIRREDVPEYLRKGVWYETLDPDDEGAFEVPSDYFKADQSIQSTEDLLFLLRTLRFWQVEHIPVQALYFIYACNKFDIGNEFPMLLCTLRKLKDVKESSPKERICTALKAKLGLEMARWLHKHTNCELSAGACAAAAGADDVESLAYLHEFGCPWDANTIKEAIKGGSITCLEYARAHGCPALPAGERAINYAAQKGNIEMIRHLRNSGEEWDDLAMRHAMVFGAPFACLQYLHEAGCPWSVEVCQRAAHCGRLDCLQYAHEHGCPWDELVPAMAALFGHLACLQYAHQSGCPWDPHVLYYAAQRGHLNCMKYAYERGCPWVAETANVAFVTGHWQCLYYAVRHGVWWFDVFIVCVMVCSWCICSFYFFADLYALYCGDTTKRELLLSQVATMVFVCGLVADSVISHLGQELRLYISLENQRMYIVRPGAVCFYCGLGLLIYTEYLK